MAVPQLVVTRYIYLSGRVAPINAAAGTGFTNLHCAQCGQDRQRTLPDPAGQILAGGVFQAGNVIEVVVIELIENRFECRFDISEINHPTGMCIDFVSHINSDLKAVPVQTSAFMSIRHIRQPVRGLKMKLLINLGNHIHPQIVGAMVKRDSSGVHADCERNLYTSDR